MGRLRGIRAPGDRRQRHDRLRPRRVRDRAGEVRLLARSDASAWRAEEQAQGEAAKLDRGAPERIKVTTDAGRPRRLRPRGRGDRRGRRRQGRAARRARRGAAPDADLATTTSSLSIGELGRAQRLRRALLRPPRLQPGAADGAGRALPPRARSTPGSPSARGPGARRSARPRSRCPTRPGSSSTGCSSPTCSTPCGCWSERAGGRGRRRLHAARRRAPDGPAASCSTSSASTSRSAIGEALHARAERRGPRSRRSCCARLVERRQARPQERRGLLRRRVAPVTRQPAALRAARP